MVRHTTEETVPLTGGPRRRVGPQHEEHMFSQALPAPTKDKEDRRTLFGRLASICRALPCSTILRFSRGGGGNSGSEQPNGGGDEHYYEDDAYNELSWKWSCGTMEDDGIWMNRTEQSGIIMGFSVWILIFYSCVTVTLLAQHNGLSYILAGVHCTLCALALASHAKTTYTDPGAVSRGAVPVDTFQGAADPNTIHSMCSICQTYKPPVSHHCRICGRCISRMDHHCPWMNNCVGAGNMKHFILFLGYVWTASLFALLLFAWNYFMCATEECTFSLVLVQLVRAMTVICISAWLFTSSMLMNIAYGLMTGIGTIDRLKNKATNQSSLTDEEPVDMKEIFGIRGYHTWPFPVDPVFENYDKVMGYSTMQRLLREQSQHLPLSSTASISPSSTASTWRQSGTFSPKDSKGYSSV